MTKRFTLRCAIAWIFKKFLGQSWADAIRNEDFGIIADWFATYFFTSAIFALICVGIAAGLSGANGLGPETHARDVALYAASHGGSAPAKSGLAAKNRPAKTLADATASAQNSESTRRNVGLGFRVFSLGLLLSGACTSIGWVLGLLFGVPRAGTAAPANSGSSATTSARQVNSNLVEISDWLTKTIVGVGLTQLMVLPKFLGDLAADINRFGFQWGDYGHLLALGVILYFVPGGFWLGYVGARTLLTGLLDRFALPVPQVQMAAAPENLQLDSANKILPATAAVQQIDAALRAVPLQSLQNPDDVVAWGAAQARAENLGAARTAFESALAGDPDNPEIARQLLKVYLALKLYPKAVELARKLPDSAPKMLALLYDAPPNGFTEAMEIGVRLLKDSANQNSAALHVWLAAAYGQQYSYEKSLGHADTLEDVQKRVEAEVTKAVELDPTTRDFLRSLWRPAAGSIENDLKDIPQDDLVLTKVLGVPAAPAPPAPATPVTPAAIDEP